MSAAPGITFSLKSMNHCHYCSLFHVEGRLIKIVRKRGSLQIIVVSNGRDGNQNVHRILRTAIVESISACLYGLNNCVSLVAVLSVPMCFIIVLDPKKDNF